MKSVLMAISAAALGIGTAQAASTAYFMDQSNALPDGSAYLKVTLTETGSGVDFQVETLDPLNDIAGANFGIQEFGFNFATNTPYDSIVGLPADWKIANDKQMSEFGRYDIVLKGRGFARADTLHISILGEDLSLSDFDDFFSAHVTGFDWNSGNNTPTGPVVQSLILQDEGVIGLAHDKDKGCYADGCVTGGYFGGGTPAAVPIPAGAWLFGSGLLGLFGVVPRKKLRQ